MSTRKLLFQCVGSIKIQISVLAYFKVENTIISMKSSLICSTCHKHFPVLSPFMSYHRVYNQSNTTVPLVEQELLLFRSTGVHPGFQWGWCYSIFSFMCNVCRSLSSLRLTDFDYLFGIFKLFIASQLLNWVLNKRNSFTKTTKQHGQLTK